ncbi:MAG: hypothetical protein WKG32_23145 [Gemmatimonadaceae bacterium]
MRRTMLRLGQLIALAGALTAFGFGAQEAYAAGVPKAENCQYTCYAGGQAACTACCTAPDPVYDFGECVQPANVCFCGYNL